MDLIDLIPMGHDNTISRKELTSLTGMSDRKVRKRIESATRAGSIIINIDDGYFRYSSVEDIPYMESYYKREMARGWSIINKCRIIRKFINKRCAYPQKDNKQISIFDYMRDREV